SRQDIAFAVGNRMLDQARRQMNAAGKTPIKWVFAEEKAAKIVGKMFELNRIKIDVVHQAPKAFK
ncbi:MAG: hypothetical protein AAF711_19600, partial [Planctomycetota bacterium]